jgi:predicted nucleotidyltransferase
VEPVEVVLRQAAADLDAIGARWALIGGLAVSFRAEPRFTKDVDLALAVADDHEAEAIVNRMQVRGYALTGVVEQDHVGRMATARLVRPTPGMPSAFVDLLFASSGIEGEIVRQADLVEVLPDIVMPVARVAHLIALKLLAGRNQDLTDIGYLLTVASVTDLAEAQKSVEMIVARGFNRGLDLAADLTAIIREAQEDPPK